MPEPRKHPGGRPRKFKSVAGMQEAIGDYFDRTLSDRLTVTGLAIALGFTSRQDLINYEGYNPEFHDALKTAKLRIENSYELALRGGKGGAPEIFALKNFGWTDKQQIEHSGAVHVHFDQEDKSLL